MPLISHILNSPSEWARLDDGVTTGRNTIVLMTKHDVSRTCACTHARMHACTPVQPRTLGESTQLPLVLLNCSRRASQPSHHRGVHTCTCTDGLLNPHIIVARAGDDLLNRTIVYMVREMQRGKKFALSQASRSSSNRTLGAPLGVMSAPGTAGSAWAGSAPGPWSGRKKKSAPTPYTSIRPCTLPLTRGQVGGGPCTLPLTRGQVGGGSGQVLTYLLTYLLTYVLTYVR